MKKFKDAYKGLVDGFKSEKGVRLQILLGLITVIYCIYLHLSISDWIVIILCIGFVISIEYVNTSIEKVCDLIDLKTNDKIRFIKDVSAGAVSIASITALIVMVLILIKNGGILR